MNILFLLSIDIERTGPSVHLLKDMLHNCAERGHKIDVISKSDDANSVCTDKQYTNITHYRIQANEKKKNWIKRYLNEIVYMQECSNVYRDKKYDVVFLQSCNVSYFATKLIRRYLKTRIVYNVQDIFPHNLKLSGNLPYSKILFPIFSYLQRRAYLNVDRIVTISRDMKELLSSETAGKTDIDVIHNWGYYDKVKEIDDSENLFIQHCIKEYNMKKGAFNIVYAGNMGVVQNVEIILEAAEALRDNLKCHFWFIGEGAKKETLIRKAEALQLKNVSFLPLQNEKIAPFIYSMADVNVIPLQKGVIRTALPSKTPACLASGRNIIACIEKDSELAEILLKTEGCYVVDNIKAKEFVETIKKISSMGRRIYKDREESLNIFSAKNCPKEYIDILETAAKY